MKKSTKILIATAMVLGVSGGVFAYGKHSHWGFSPEEKAEFVQERVTKKLDLNETQQQNFQVLVGDVMSLMKEMRADREAYKAQIQEMISEPVLDQAKALQMIDAKTRQVNEKAPEVIASLALFLDSLESSQKDQMKEFMSKRMRHGHGHKGYDDK